MWWMKKILAVLMAVMFCLGIGMAEDADADMPAPCRAQAIAAARFLMGMELAEEPAFVPVSVTGTNEFAWLLLDSAEERPVGSFRFDADGRLISASVITYDASDVGSMQYDGEEALARIENSLRNTDFGESDETLQMISNPKYTVVGDMEQVRFQPSEGPQWICLIVTGPGEAYFDHCVIEIHVDLDTEMVTGISFTYLD